MQNHTIVPDQHLCYIYQFRTPMPGANGLKKKKQNTCSGFFFLYKPHIVWKHTFLAGALWVTTVLAQELSISH